MAAAPDGPTWFEWVKLLPGCLTAATAIWGIKAGLSKWRSETIGKRKAEVAEQVLAGFYEAREIIAFARSPAGWGNEGNSRQPALSEREADTALLNSYYRAIERLNKKSEFFAQLAARRYGFIALFGSDAARPFDEIFGIRQEIVLAVQMLSDTHMQTRGMLREKEAAETEWTSTIGWGARNDDKIASRLDSAIAAIETVCRPAIKEREL
jgi:hypothetical protein